MRTEEEVLECLDANAANYRPENNNKIFIVTLVVSGLLIITLINFAYKKIEKIKQKNTRKNREKND